MPPVDFRGRFIWLLKSFLILFFLLAGAYGIGIVGGIVRARANMVRCDANLKQIGQALMIYKRQFKNRLPAYLTALYPDFLTEKDVLICPADPNHGTQGAFPRWTRYTRDGKPQPDWLEEFSYADLDGPSLIPWQHGSEPGDKDTFPCSYYYRFNDYPADITNLVDAITWQQHMKEITREFGDKTPIVSCLWHLRPYATETEGDTLNLLVSLTQTARYPRKWTLIKRQDN